MTAVRAALRSLVTAALSLLVRSRAVGGEVRPPSARCPRCQGALGAIGPGLRCPHCGHDTGRKVWAA